MLCSAGTSIPSFCEMKQGENEDNNNGVIRHTIMPDDDKVVTGICYRLRLVMLETNLYINKLKIFL